MFKKGFCIYCDRNDRKLTKEHRIADWLKPFLNLDDEEIGTVHGLQQFDFGTGNEKREKKYDSGNPYSFRIWQVCKTCNGGWMSDLQQIAKPVLVPLLNSRKYTLDISEQTLLSRWIAMTVMISEHYRHYKAAAEGPAISESERSHIMRPNTGAPDSWRIFIGYIDREHWPRTWVYGAVPLKSEPDGVAPKRHGDSICPNTQSTIFTVGRLFFWAMSSAIPDVVHDLKLPSNYRKRLRQIWPIERDVAYLTKGFRIDDDLAEDMASYSMRAWASFGSEDSDVDPASTP